jgi:hypothetical protein
VSTIGNLGAAHDLDVDARGCVAAPAGWRLDWLVGAGDRWLEPATATGATITQHRPGGLPVVETSLRVPGGQLVHRAWCATVAGGGVAVVEVENRSRDAVALAFVVEGGVGGVGFDGDRTVVGRGRAAVRAGRAPARVVAGEPDAVRATVTAGAAPLPQGSIGPAPALGLVFPLAHTARLRLVLPLGAADVDRLDVDAVAGADQVVAGWQAHLDAGVRLGIPDPDFVDAVSAARTTLLVNHDRRRSLVETAHVGLALALWGHGDAAATTLADIVAHQRLDGGFGDRRSTATTATVLFALAAQSITDAGRLAEVDHDLAEPVAKAAHRLARRHRRGDQPTWFSTAQLAAAMMLDRLGQHDAADLCRERIAGSHPSAVLPDIERTVPPLEEIAGRDARASARYLVHARRLLVDDTEPGLVRLLTLFPDEWLGRDLEVHRLPTGSGTLSFAIRWHGARPALLWELDASGPAHLVVGLDPDWTADAPAGEALLSPVEPAGGLPKVVAPLSSAGVAAADAADDTASFS